MHPNSTSVGDGTRGTTGGMNRSRSGSGFKLDAVFGFNLGLTCPDYDWADVALLATCEATVGKPLVMVTNTLMELVMDRDVLEDDHGVAILSPPEPAGGEEDEFGGGSGGGDFDEYGELDDGEFGAENPYAWIAWRQSGTLANDVYRKNSYIGSGIIVPSSPHASPPPAIWSGGRGSSLSQPPHQQQHKKKKKNKKNKNKRNKKRNQGF